MLAIGHKMRALTPYYMHYLLLIRGNWAGEYVLLFQLLSHLFLFHVALEKFGLIRYIIINFAAPLPISAPGIVYPPWDCGNKARLLQNPASHTTPRRLPCSEACRAA